MSDARKPTSFLNYTGDRRGILNDPATRLGPNTLGEWLYPVTAEYDAEKNRTRVGLSLVAPEAVAR